VTDFPEITQPTPPEFKGKINRLHAYQERMKIEAKIRDLDIEIQNARGYNGDWRRVVRLEAHRDALHEEVSRLHGLTNKIALRWEDEPRSGTPCPYCKTYQMSESRAFDIGICPRCNPDETIHPQDPQWNEVLDLNTSPSFHNVTHNQ